MIFKTDFEKKLIKFEFDTIHCVGKSEWFLKISKTKVQNKQGDSIIETDAKKIDWVF